MKENEKREHPRVDLFTSLRGEVTVNQPVEIREISARGMLVATAIELNLDAQHQFRLTIGDRAAVLTGRVAHTRLSQIERGAPIYLSGIQFVQVSESSQSVINGFLQLMRLAEVKWRTHEKGAAEAPAVDRLGGVERESD